METIGLVLSGGGARAAYQAGVLSAIAEISGDLKIENPFQIYSGVSAGAINACMLAGTPESFRGAVDNLVSLWSLIQSDQVFKSNPLSLSKGAFNWITELSSGGLKMTPGISLLQTDPLRDLIKKNCHFEHIQKKIDAGILRAVSISAMDYFSTSTVSFVQGHSEIKDWSGVRRRSMRQNLNVDHVMASSAIPLLFPPARVNDFFYGDGCIRNLSPCSPAIYMGARRIIAIGVRRQQEGCYNAENAGLQVAPSLARVVNVLLHAVMMDGLELDIERIERINQNLKLVSEAERKTLSISQVEYLWISPSCEISKIAAKRVGDLPIMIRYLLKGLGTLEEASELTSFLLFEKEFCKELIEIGYQDGMKSKEKIKTFISSAQ